MREVDIPSAGQAQLGGPRAAGLEQRRSESARGTVVIGVVAARGASRALARKLAEELPRHLHRRFPDIDWKTEVAEEDPAAPSADSTQLTETVHRELIDNGWDLAIGLTDLPLRSDGRPVTALITSSHRTALVSVPALGALGLERRLEEAVEYLVEGLLGESVGEQGVFDRAGRERRLRERLHELSSPLGPARVREDGTVRFVSATLLGNLRLLVGLVRANEPSKVIVRLTKAVVGALGLGVFAVVSQNVWLLADGMSWPRLLGIAILATAGTCLALVLAHHLWARADNRAARERVVLFNLTTLVTLAIATLTQYLALLTISTIAAAAMIAPGVLERALQHPVGVADYLQLACVVATLATIGGALGSLVESDLDVRNAAYRSQSDARIEARDADKDR